MWVNDNSFEVELFEKQKKRIIEILLKALECPYYKNTLGIDEAKLKSGSFTYEDFRKLPVVTKKDYASNIFKMINPKFNVNKEDYDVLNEDFNKKKSYLLDRGLYVKVTSGSTGKPLEVIKSVKDIDRDYFALNVFRKQKLGRLLKGTFLWIWPTNKYTQKYFYSEKESYYKVNDYGYQYMIAEYSDVNFAELQDFIDSHNITWITASPSALVYFADYLKTHGDKRYSFEYIECHSEYLKEWQADVIETQFGYRPTNVYSSNEIQFMGFSCSKGHMHLITRNVFLELEKNEMGRNEVIVTSLNNPDIPLIRYKLGDCAEWIDDTTCELSKYPAIKLKEYRVNDYLLDRNGKKYEPFVVCDATLFIEKRYKINIEKYIVYQPLKDKLIWFIDSKNNSIDREQEIIKYLEAFFLEVTGTDYDIEIRNYNNAFNYLKTNKYKYFVLGNNVE